MHQNQPHMSSLTTYLNSKCLYMIEGHCQDNPSQVEDLIRLTDKPNVRVMEIGFNGGHSAEVFLKNNSTLTLTSFDLGEHHYVTKAKEYIDSAFPKRHELYLGDSRITVPFFEKSNKGTTFDVIFIDGGHEYEIAKADMDNCLRLAHKDTVVILDDTIFTTEWEQHYTTGPTRAWTDQLEQNKIVEVGRKDYCLGKGMSWGNYVL